MKAKTIDNSPFGWNTTVYDNDDYPMEYTLNGLVNKHDAVGVTESFNLELSAHVAKETAPLLAEIDRLKKEVEMQNQDINNHQQTTATLNKMYKQAIDDLTISQAEVERLKNISDDECVHENVDQKSLRCTICVDCGKILDVID